MEHDHYFNEGCDHDPSVLLLIEFKWNQLVKAFRMNELSVVSID